MKLFVAGSANVDLSFRLEGRLQWGKTHVAPFQQGYGGKGANQSVQAARLGADVNFLGNVGEDAYGDLIIGHLAQEGIHTRHIARIPGLSTGSAVILVAPDGQNTIITHGGPNLRMTVEQVQSADADIGKCDYVLATLELPAEVLFELFRIARSQGVRVILNPAPPVDFPIELLKLVDVCLPNESELAAITRLPTASSSEIEHACRELMRLGPDTIVATLGDRGALICDRDGIEWLAAEPVTVVDTSGAGDSFSAALAVALGEGRSLRDAARWANHVASFSVSQPGTQSSFVRREELKSIH